MTWTKEDEREFMEYVRERNEGGICPFHPSGLSEPPTEADLTAMIPLRLEWAVDIADSDKPQEQERQATLPDVDLTTPKK